MSAPRAMRARATVAAVAIAGIAAGSVHAQPTPAPASTPAAAQTVAARPAVPTLSLEASARAMVPNDEMVVTLASQRDGTEIAALNDAVLGELNAAIADANAVAGVRARLGSVWTQPSFDRDGRRTGWRVRGEVVLVSRDLPSLSRLAGRLSERMQLAGVAFRLSDERRVAEERRLLTQAADAFNTRAREAAAAFGFGGYRLRELSLRDASQGPPPRPMMRAATAEMATAALPAEGGDSEVVVTVSGTVELQ